MKILCIKHIEFEGPGVIALWAQRRGHELEIIPLYQNQALPSLDGCDALVVMGGPMSVYDADEYPWLTAEQHYIREAIASGKHVLGICLGAQLIASAMGAKIAKSANKEIGWFPIYRSGGCPSTLPLPEVLKVLHWHSDTFSIPLGAKTIASSEACENQGFIYQSTVLTLQCHLEITRESLAVLATSCSHELIDSPYIQSFQQLYTEPDETYLLMHEALFQLLDEWVQPEHCKRVS